MDIKQYRGWFGKNSCPQNWELKSNPSYYKYTLSFLKRTDEITMNKEESIFDFKRLHGYYCI